MIYWSLCNVFHLALYLNHFELLFFVTLSLPNVIPSSIVIVYICILVLSLIIWFSGFFMSCQKKKLFPSLFIIGNTHCVVF